MKSTELTPEYEEMFASGRFPSAHGKLFPTDVNALAGILVAVFAGVPMLAAATLPFILAFADSRAVPKVLATVSRGLEAGDMGKAFGAVIPWLVLTLICIPCGFAGLRVVRMPWKNRKEIADRQRGFTHFGAWVDDHFLVLRTRDGTGKVTGLQIARKDLILVENAWHRTKNGRMECVRFRYQVGKKAATDDLTSDTFHQGTRQALKHHLEEWMKSTKDAA